MDRQFYRREKRSFLSKGLASALIGIFAARTSEAATPSVSKFRESASLREFGAIGDGATDDTDAISAAFASGRDLVAPPGTYLYSSGALFSAVGQQFRGFGKQTTLKYSGNTAAMSFNSKAKCGAYDFALISTGKATTGIDVPALSHSPHLERIEIGANGASFTEECLKVASTFYGTFSGLELVHSACGIRLTNQANGNTFSGCWGRQNGIGIEINDLGGSSAGNAIIGGGFESANPASTYAVKLIGGSSNQFHGVRLEYVFGSAHVHVNSGVGVAQFNEFHGCPMHGTIVAFAFGDGVGSRQVVGTYVNGGRGGAIIINADCVYTRIQAAPSEYAGMLIDRGYGSSIHIDHGTLGRWYDRSRDANTDALSRKTVVGSTAVTEDYGDLKKRLDFASLSDAFEFYAVNPAGIGIAVMRFGNYRIWVSPTNGKLYINGADPKSDTDGTVIGSQA